MVGVSINRDLNDTINNNELTGPYQVYRNINNKIDLVNFMPAHLRKDEVR